MFSGNSRYSSDFQAVISRATAIASLPITQLNTDQSNLTDQGTSLTGLNTAFTNLQTAIAGIQTAMGGASFQSTVSDPTQVGVSLSDGAQEGEYSIQVIDAGTYATSMTGDWAPDSTTDHSFQLSVGGNLYTIDPADDSAASVASAINSQYGDQVRATVVNVNTPDDPSYRISLQAAQLGDLAPDILDNGVSLQAQSTTGALARYIVNQSGNEVDSSSRSVAIADGINLTLLKTGDGTTPVDITVTRSTSALSDALTTFATDYNAAVDEVDKQHGTTPGTLAGNPVVGDLGNVLSGLATYSSNGSIDGLKTLGFDLGDDGHLTYDAFTLMGLDIQNSAGIESFFGGASTSGFLKYATDALNSVEQSGTGILPAAQADNQAQISNIQSEITDKQAKVDQLTATITAQMATADALIATMEQQYNVLSGMFQAMQTDETMYK
ncbi:MAG TPA: flagellar filament capping protein FliD [Bryobacteraceae bacterium]|nr:flagellar filament capping protein FliD [Bryobacteraceae bacterium]